MERTRTIREDLGGGPSGFDDIFAPAEPDVAPVTVSHGTFSEQLPIAGQTIAEIRARYADRFDLGPLSQAVLDGEDVDDDTIVGAGQMVVFMHRAGEKGAPPRRSAGDFAKG